MNATPFTIGVISGGLFALLIINVINKKNK
jgi:hypothetical protein